MAAVVHEQNVAGLGGGHQIGEGGADVPAGGLRFVTIRVNEDGDMLRRKAVSVEQAAVHPPHIVDAPLQLRLGARVVAAYQHRPLRHILFPALTTAGLILVVNLQLRFCINIFTQREVVLLFR